MRDRFRRGWLQRYGGSFAPVGGGNVRNPSWNSPVPGIEESSLLVREIYPAPENAYEVHTATHAQLQPEFLAPIVQRARQQQLSVIFLIRIHSRREHPPSHP